MKKGRRGFLKMFGLVPAAALMGASKAAEPTGKPTTECACPARGAVIYRDAIDKTDRCMRCDGIYTGNYAASHFSAGTEDIEKANR